MRRIDYAGVTGPILLKGVDALQDVLDQIIPDWPRRSVPASAETSASPELVALACISRGPEGLVAHSQYLDSPMPGLTYASATGALVADLSQSYIDTTPGTLALHCGAVQIGGRLVVLTGAHKAGKSTLVARLTMAPDMQVFCDDVLPIRPDGQGGLHGVALGIAPRLRLPLPVTASAEFRAHVARWTPVQDARYAYLCPPGRAPHGAQAPLGAIITLDRHPSGPARLHHMAPDAALRQVLSRNLADPGTAEAAFDSLSALVEGMTCLRLVYADLEDAVALLRTAFGGRAAVNPALEIGPDCTQDALPEQAFAPIDPHQGWQQNPAVALRRVGESHFLWMAQDTTLWQLNPLAGAIWALLEIPGSAVDLAGALAEVFPDQPEGGILSDTALLLSHLAGQGMILPA